MSELWTCPNCATRNEAVNFSCQKCSQSRTFEGATAVETLPVPRGRRSRSVWSRIWWIPVAAALGFFLFSPDGVQRGEDGRIIKSAPMSVHDLLVGDCFDWRDGSIDEDGIEHVDLVTGIPCDSPHEYEVFHIAVLQPGPYPTQFRFDRVFDGECLQQFENYVGTQWEVSDVWADMLWPTEEGWNDGDHSVTCFIFDLDGPVVGSLRNSFR